MHWNFEKLFAHFSRPESVDLLRQGLWGLEKENLRVQPNGDLALSPHPPKLGPSLNHPRITTDFSESQVEMITAPFPSFKEALSQLHEIECEVVASLENDEMLWPFSMPCRLPETELIPIAQYGDSDEAKQKETYRRGLALRYGKMMQMISGLHYNFSFTQDFWDELIRVVDYSGDRDSFISESYLHLTRNFLRDRWMLAYLFGASPVRDESYTCKAMTPEDSEAVSLRLSRCGYSNPAKMNVSYNSLEEHLADLDDAVATSHPPYEALGLEIDGMPQQLNANLLQVANEFYAPIRIKPPHGDGDMLQSLHANGAIYVEVRLVDIDPYSSCGITLQGGHLLHLFLVSFLLNDSPSFEEGDEPKARHLQEDVALHGQNLLKDRKEVLIKRLNELKPLAIVLDGGKDSSYQDALEFYQKEVANPQNLSWKRLVDDLENSKKSFLSFGLELAKKHHESHLNPSS
jgi:glutamate--cysteine ligase